MNQNRAVDPNSFLPGSVNGGLMDQLQDQVTGASLVLDRAKDASVDSIRAVPVEPSVDLIITISCVNGNGTNYVFGTPVLDLADYGFLTVLPQVTAAGTVAATVFWKFQWSIDGVNWIDDFIDSTNINGDAYAAAGGGERLIGSTGYLTRSFPIATGYKGNQLGACALLVPKKARYMQIGQKMNAAVTGTETVNYHIQLL